MFHAVFYVVLHYIYKVLITIVVYNIKKVLQHLALSTLVGNATDFESAQLAMRYCDNWREMCPVELASECVIAPVVCYAALLELERYVVVVTCVGGN